MKRNKNLFSKAPRVFKADLQSTTDGNILVPLPKKILTYLGLKENCSQVFWTPINGTIQLSADEPSMMIPVMNLNENEFVPQKNVGKQKNEEETQVQPEN